MIRRALIFIFIVLGAFPACALESDELVLIVNKNVPDGLKLAQYYSAQRKVPAGRIIELNLPITEEMPFAAYESEVVPNVRRFLEANRLNEKVKCAVTFYGVPIRIMPRVNTPLEKNEQATIEDELKKAIADIDQAVVNVEALARRADEHFSPQTGKTIEALTARTDYAARVLAKHIAGLKDLQARDVLSAVVGRAVDPLVGKANLAERQMQEIEATPNAPAAQVAEAARTRVELLALRAKIDDLQARRSDPEARTELRRIAKEQISPFDHARLLGGMLEQFNTADTQAAFDSELALVEWNNYPRTKWLGNPLNYRYQGPAAPKMLMTMRLDGPVAQTVTRIIDDSIQAEAKGLAGKIVLDSGGYLALDLKNPAYKAYDDTIRRLNELVSAKAKVPAGSIVFDEKRDVLPVNSAKDVALYCGWYAVRNYTPACRFVPGAVGYHIGSYEMVSLRNEGETGWCRGLLLDGIAATLGPESEPFLMAFPEADEFFPLLMTGKLTLGEVYWKTNPQTSWRITMIGDPLYNPYKANPILAVEDLPARLRAIFQARSAPKP